VHAYVNPLVEWIWLGGAIIVFGIGWSLSQRMREKHKRTSAATAQGHAA